MPDQTEPIKTNHLFEQLYQNYKQDVYNYVCYLLRTEHEMEAADLFQETWLRVVKYLSSIQQSRNPKAFILTIATNIFRDHLRHKKARSKIGYKEELGSNNTGCEPGTDIQQDPAQQSEMKDSAHLAQCALEKLPQKLKQVFVLREINCLSYGEIAASLQISEGTAKSRMHRAKRKLRAILAPQISIPVSGGGKYDM